MRNFLFRLTMVFIGLPMLFGEAAWSGAVACRRSAARDLKTWKRYFDAGV